MDLLETKNSFCKEFHKTASFVSKHIDKNKTRISDNKYLNVCNYIQKKSFITQTLSHAALLRNGFPSSIPMFLNNAFDSYHRDRTNKQLKKDSQASMYLENALQTRKATLVENIKYLCTPSTGTRGGASSRTASYLGVKIDTPKKLINYLTLKRLKWMS